MTLAWLSLGALVVAMIVSCFSTLNVGVLALALAWIVGVYLGSMSLNDVLSGFPTQLFLTLAGVTLLFTQAQLNGTLDRVAHAAVRICRGNTGLIPVMFFVLGSIIASLGPGNVATAAMLAPMAMAIAARASIPPFLMAIMVGNGAQSGALSPVAPTGIIVTGLMDKIGLGGYELRTYIANLLAHAIIAFGGYFLLGGLGLFRRR
jgi:di/tricarboxylate transporter